MSKLFGRNSAGRLSRLPRGAGSWALLTAVAVLSGCGESGSVSGGIDDRAFISGTGTVTITPAADRGEPVALTGPLIGGNTLDVATLRGKVVLINVWGSWCAPCRKEAPDLQQAWAGFAGEDVQFLGLNTRDDAAGAAEAFERRFGITYPSLRDPDGSLQLTFRTSLPPRAIPSTLVLDRTGRVAARIVGPSTTATFRGLVEQILAERP
ncbi:MAG: TlpA family protein disulfide reductase [Sporichthyaceae bacterium]